MWPLVLWQGVNCIVWLEWELVYPLTIWNIKHPGRKIKDPMQVPEIKG